jgi:hypothetical protein
MKSLVLVFLAVLAVCGSVAAQDAEVAIGSQFLVEEGQTTPRFTLDAYSYFSEKMGVWGYGYAEKGYASAVVGPFLDIATFGEDGVFEVGIGAGGEVFTEEEGEECECQSYSRFAGFVFVGNETLWSEVHYENGASKESWLRANVLWQTNDWIALGATHQTGDGTGPKVVLSAPKFPVRLWAAPMFGEEENKFLFGLDLVFQKKKK